MPSFHKRCNSWPLLLAGWWTLATQNGEFGGPIAASKGQRSFAIPDNSRTDNIPSAAAAYSLNVTVVPQGSLGYLTVWPTGENQPVVSTMNSYDGRVKANAAIVPAGTDGAVSFFVTNTSDRDPGY